ncbi:TniQ family protein [Sinorhizobium fredii]|uniref:TniQ domain-containing protein n=13 Tax=Sinorhizobium/Ensifer group TaxID=227292 RepID=A0A844AK96_RHIFR|nr:TniQ family protein [Sinorhizobium fredii]MQX12701.1 hypothetical protein [Sinorhizobium fredii]UTY47882.1 hypothetical protein EPK84_12575 [Sinorhizobium fredii]UTY47901.1 hypothetical protein EPK84_14180 [Sinorhizobium fredii]
MGISARQLPVRLAPYPDELLSSWIIRHAAFYEVPPLAMLQHCLPEVQSLRTSDLDMTESQVARIARMFSADPARVLRMTFSNIARSSRRLIASEPRQLCCSCSPITNELQPVLRSQFLGWRITCPLCGNVIQNTDGGARPSPFSRYHNSALIGEQLLDDEAERGMQNWMAPSEIAGLLLMRRVPKAFPAYYERSGYRVLGVIIPDLDDVLRMETSKLPSRASTLLPLHLRPALLAGVAIVQRAGPEMLHMLRSHMMGENKARFGSAIDEILDCARQSRTSSQLHLI